MWLLLIRSVIETECSHSLITAGKFNVNRIFTLTSSIMMKKIINLDLFYLSKHRNGFIFESAQWLQTVLRFVMLKWNTSSKSSGFVNALSNRFLSCTHWRLSAPCVTRTGPGLSLLNVSLRVQKRRVVCSVRPWIRDPPRHHRIRSLDLVEMF
jgi:hypothetical protein